MNAGPAATPPLAETPPAGGWRWRKVLVFIVFAFAAHLAFVLLLGTKKTAAQRAVTRVPVFHLADIGDELIRLTDPTLWVLPHTEDSAPVAWSFQSVGTNQMINYTEDPLFLLPVAADFGAAFNNFIQTNRFATTRLNLKPEPHLVLPVATVAPLPQNSSWQLTGEIAGRRILNAFAVPTLPLNDVLQPTRVQLLVDVNGDLLSTVLLDSSADSDADQLALKLTRTLRFVPADHLMFGELICNWQTVPKTP